MILSIAVVMIPIRIRFVGLWWINNTLFRAHLLLLFYEKEKSLCATLAGHRAAILFNQHYRKKRHNINYYILLHKFTIIPNYLLHQPTFASYRQGLIGHTQVVRLLPTRLKRIGSSELSVTLLLLHYNQSEERCRTKVVTSTLLWYILYSAYMNLISYLFFLC